MRPPVSYLALAFAAVMAPFNAVAQEFPSRPIRIIVPFPPGGTVDGVVRPIAQELSRSLGQPVVIENKAGAGTVVGVDAAAKAAPDGYTLVAVANSFTINPTLVANLPYDPQNDFRPVGMMTRTASVLVANPRTPGADLRELVSFAKANPGKLTYGSSGSGTSQHIAAEMFKAVAKVSILHVPYKGGVPALTDLMGGQIDLLVLSLPEMLPHIRAGRIKSFGVFSAQRVPAAPELPTVAEQGYPGVDADTWYGLMAPARVPDQVIQRLNTELGRALRTPAIQSSFSARAIETSPGTAEEFAAFIRSELSRNAKIIKEFNIRPD